MNRQLLRRVAKIRSVPPHIVAITAAASFAAQIATAIIGWPLWAIALVTLVPWIPLLTLEMAWTYRHYGVLAFFYVLVITQLGHFGEHVVQMIQIHVLDRAPKDAHGVFGKLDIEWVHFTWNSWVLLAVLFLLWRLGPNLWLVAAALLAGWHELEHVVIMASYLADGVPGDPGLLSKGGRLGGGVDAIRPDVHFVYNLVETTPLVIAFVYTLKRSYDEWVAKALPTLSEPLLVEATNRLETLRVRAGDVVVRQGEAADRFYIVSRGRAAVVHVDEDGRERELAVIGPGQYFGEIGILASMLRTATVRAAEDLELLALDRESFRSLVSRSSATAEDLERVVRERLAATATA